MTKEEEKEMDDKVVLTLGMMDLLAEYVGDIQQHDRYKHLFRFQLKRAAKSFIKESDRVLDLMCSDKNEIGQLILDVSTGLDELLKTAEFTHNEENETSQ